MRDLKHLIYFCLLYTSILGSDGKIDVGLLSPITFDPVHNKYLPLGAPVADAFRAGLAVRDAR